MEDTPPAPEMFAEKPHVIMVVGVNGVGKTTTIGKPRRPFPIAGQEDAGGRRRHVQSGRRRTARHLGRPGGSAVRQRKRPGGTRRPSPSTPWELRVARGIDVALIDTAGRLHTNVNLMEEVKKIKRAVAKKMPGAPHEVLLVLDASTGQNAVLASQHVQRRHRRHRHGPDQARRDRQGRHRGQHLQQPQNSPPVRRYRRKNRGTSRISIRNNSWRPCFSGFRKCLFSKDFLENSKKMYAAKHDFY